MTLESKNIKFWFVA